MAHPVWALPVAGCMCMVTPFGSIALNRLLILVLGPVIRDEFWELSGLLGKARIHRELVFNQRYGVQCGDAFTGIVYGIFLNIIS